MKRFLVSISGRDSVAIVDDGQVVALEAVGESESVELYLKRLAKAVRNGGARYSSIEHLRENLEAGTAQPLTDD
jgi:hypothetical protein